MTTMKEQATIAPEVDALLARLKEPFDAKQVRWRVTHTSKDGHSGAVIAYADPRAYTDRLNLIFTPSGWTRQYEVNTLSSVSRMKHDKLIATGKVLVTCALTIHGLGSHTGSGEEWADEANAMTSAEAQAFKRSACCYGLGRYLYDLPEMWVPLNEYRQPTRLPDLPKWALPKDGSARQGVGADRFASVQRGPISQETTSKIAAFRRSLGGGIFGEILWRIAHADKPEGIPNAQLQQDVIVAMERATRGLERVNALGEEVGDTQFIGVLDRLQIRSLATIPNIETLKRLVVELEGLTDQQAA